jgi:hypothetical protein
MRPNLIVKNDLESRAIELRGMGKTFPEISAILSKESRENISQFVVYRYFQSNEKAAAQAVEKSDKLKIKVVETEINTINKRVEIIDKFLEIAEQAQECGDFKAAILALRGATEAQDSLDERLGKLKARTNNNTVNVLNVQEAIHGARERFINAIVCNNGQNSEGEDSQQFY